MRRGSSRQKGPEGETHAPHLRCTSEWEHSSPESWNVHLGTPSSEWTEVFCLWALCAPPVPRCFLQRP